jgi:hypothetical protein
MVDPTFRPIASFHTHLALLNARIYFASCTGVAIFLTAVPLATNHCNICLHALIQNFDSCTLMFEGYHVLSDCFIMNFRNTKGHSFIPCISIFIKRGA